MTPLVHVAIHRSQFPEQVRRDLRESLRSRRVNHKFHYESVKQTQKWLALHEAYSPARTDPNCAAVYDSGFAAAVKMIQEPAVHLIGLGCGGGQKDARLLQLLRAAGKEVAYTPVDVSVAMVLAARATVLKEISSDQCHPVVCDLATAEDVNELPEEQDSPKHARLVTFFGMIPNFEPGIILPRLAGWLRPLDSLLFSANLAPGDDYAAGVQRILPLYDNALTRDWLLSFLLDLGVERGDGELRFIVEDDAGGSGLKRVAAHFHFVRERIITLDEERFEFGPGESIRLFFSYRHMPGRIRDLLGKQGLGVVDEWITRSGEEGVFLCQRMKTQL